jgi:hypothetical protein
MCGYTREPHPQRVAQRPAGQREAERVVLVHQVGDEAEAAAGVEQTEGGGGQRGHGAAKFIAPSRRWMDIYTVVLHK